MTTNSTHLGPLTFDFDAREWSHWTRLTFGVMPDPQDFERRFDLACPGGTYTITNLGDWSGEWTCSELLERIAQATDTDFDLDDDDSPINVASSVLYTLGIEWI